MGKHIWENSFWGGSPYEDVSDLTVAIGDTYGDDAGFQELELMMGVLDMDFNKVAQPGGQISN